MPIAGTPLIDESNAVIICILDSYLSIMLYILLIMFPLITNSSKWSGNTWELIDLFPLGEEIDDGFKYISGAILSVYKEVCKTLFSGAQ